MSFNLFFCLRTDSSQNGFQATERWITTQPRLTLLVISPPGMHDTAQGLVWVLLFQCSSFLFFFGLLTLVILAFGCFAYYAYYAPSKRWPSFQPDFSTLEMVMATDWLLRLCMLQLNLYLIACLFFFFSFFLAMMVKSSNSKQMSFLLFFFFFCYFLVFKSQLFHFIYYAAFCFFC